MVKRYLLSEQTYNDVRRIIDRDVIDQTPALRPRPIGGGGTTSTASYDGPFAASKYSDSVVRILGYDESASRYVKNYVAIGTKRIEIEQHDVTISQSCWVYVELEYNTGTATYDATWATSATYPAHSNGKFIFDVCWVNFSGGAITTIVQSQYGTIRHLGTVAI